jgi:hypothetical protein
MTKSDVEKMNLIAIASTAVMHAAGRVARETRAPDSITVGLR